MFELAALLLAKSYLDRFDKSNQVEGNDPNEMYKIPFSKIFFGGWFVLSLIITILSFWLSHQFEHNIIYSLAALIPAVFSLFMVPVSLVFFLKCLYIQYFRP